MVGFIESGIRYWFWVSRSGTIEFEIDIHRRRKQPGNRVTCFASNLIFRCIVSRLETDQ